jgi:hypothetical protein
MDNENRQSMRQSARWSGRAGGLDERGGAHVLDQKGCRGRMSEICEANKERSAGTHHQPPLMLSHASEGFLQNRAYREPQFGRRSREPRDGQVYTRVITRRSGPVALWEIVRLSRKNERGCGDAG